MYSMGEFILHRLLDSESDQPIQPLMESREPVRDAGQDVLDQSGCSCNTGACN